MSSDIYHDSIVRLSYLNFLTALVARQLLLNKNHSNLISLHKHNKWNKYCLDLHLLGPQHNQQRRQQWRNHWLTSQQRLLNFYQMYHNNHVPLLLAIKGKHYLHILIAIYGKRFTVFSIQGSIMTTLYHVKSGLWKCW